MPVKLTNSHGSEADDEARIEVIPLIDIMFFLLAAFMMVSLSMTQLNRIPLVLPEAESGIADSGSPPVQIAIDSAGAITWDGALVTLSEITQRLQPLAATEPEVLISADQTTMHGVVVSVLDAVRLAGIGKVSIENRP
jgi:biopolymer transport protein ExbD